MKRLYAHIRAGNPALEQRPEILKTVSVYAAIYVLHGMVNHLMRVVSCESFIGLESIGVECGTSGNVLVDFILQYSLLATRNHTGADLAAAFQDAHDGSLVLRSGTGDTALALTDVHIPRLPADETFIYLDLAAKFATKEIVSHEKPNAMQHEPCGLLCDSKCPVNLPRTDAILTVSDEPNAGQPLFKRQRRIFKDRTDLDGELPFGMANAALPAALLCQESDAVASADGASDNAIGPTPSGQIFQAIVRVGEILDGFLKGFRLANHAPIVAQSRVLRKYIIAQ